MLNSIFLLFDSSHVPRFPHTWSNKSTSLQRQTQTKCPDYCFLTSRLSVLMKQTHHSLPRRTSQRDAKLQPAPTRRKVAQRVELGQTVSANNSYWRVCFTPLNHKVFFCSLSLPLFTGFFILPRRDINWHFHDKLGYSEMLLLFIRVLILMLQGQLLWKKKF